MKSLEKLLIEGYEITIKRGLITDKTTIVDFICKMNEEKRELIQAANNYFYRANEETESKMLYETTDLFKVLFSFLYHHSKNVPELVADNNKINKKRIKK